MRKELINGKLWSVVEKDKNSTDEAKIVKTKTIFTKKVLTRVVPCESRGEAKTPVAKKVWVAVAIIAAIIFLMSVFL